MHDEVEMDVKTEGGRVIIEGKTTVPFSTFVRLILQRKVQTLKGSQDEPVIVSSKLLTKLASAPDDSSEDRGKLVVVTLAVGLLAGVFLSAVVMLLLSMFQVVPTITDYAIVAGILALLSLLVSVLQKSQKTSMKDKMYEKMEKVKDAISR